MFEDAEITIPCMNCNKKTKKTIRWIHTHVEFNCSHCQHLIHLRPDKFRREMKKAEQAVKDFTQSLTRLGN